MDEEKHRLLLEQEQESDDSVYEEAQRVQERKQKISSKRIALLALGCIAIGIFTGGVVGFLVFKGGILMVQHDYQQYHCDLATDSYLGNVPFVTKTLEADQAFLDADPGVVDSNFTGPWKSVNPSGFIALEAPALLGEGINLQRDGREPEEWTTSSVGYGISVMHQMHCVIELKRALISWEKREETESGKLGHLNHCVEILRQTVMCGGDTSLEPPRNKDVYPQDVTGWGGLHRCRDWDALITAIRSRAIVRAAGGWRKWDPVIDS